MVEDKELVEEEKGTTLIEGDITLVHISNEETPSIQEN